MYGVSSCGKESFTNIRGIKKSRPLLSPSSNRLGKNISSAAEKTTRPTLDDDQPRDFSKKGGRVNASHQKSSSPGASGPWSQAPRWKNPPGKRQSKSRGSHLPPRPQGSLPPWGVSPPPTGEELGGTVSPEGKVDSSALGCGRRGAVGNRLLLDFQSLRLMQGDSSEDSASDLSDSERVPCTPAPRAPPDLRLRAEEIDPVCFDLDLDLQPGLGQARLEEDQYRYRDVLPPSCTYDDLRDMALLPYTEHRPVTGLLGKYVDRLVQLEWLQNLTVQAERAKAAKARPPPTPGTPGPLKSPGRSQLPGSTGSRPHQDSAPKPSPACRKGVPREDGHPSYYLFEASPRPLSALSPSRSSSQTLAPDVRREEKRRRSSRSPWPPRLDPASSGNDSRIESRGNLRVPRQLSTGLDAADPRQASRQAQTNLKKKGTADNCGHTSLSSEIKLKPRGGKQSPHPFK